MEKIGIDMEKVENGEISKQMLKKHVRNVAFGQLRGSQWEQTFQKAQKQAPLSMAHSKCKNT